MTNEHREFWTVRRAMLALVLPILLSNPPTSLATSGERGSRHSFDDWEKGHQWRVSLAINFTTIDDPDFYRTVGAGFGFGFIKRVHDRVRLDLGLAATYPVAAIENWALDDFGLPEGDWQIESFQLELCPRILVDLDDPFGMHFYLIAGPEFQEILSATYLDNTSLNENIDAENMEDAVTALSFGLGFSLPNRSGQEFRFEVRRSRTLGDRLTDHVGRMDGIAIDMSFCF